MTQRNYVKTMLSTRTTIAVPLVFPFAGFAREQPGGANGILSPVAEFHGTAVSWPSWGTGSAPGPSPSCASAREKRGSFSLEVTHRTLFQVQWSRIADGIQAATVVSAGKLNLR